MPARPSSRPLRPGGRAVTEVAIAPTARALVVPSVLVTAEDGSVVDPQSPEEWDGWVSAGRTRNYLTGDPLLDWLDRYGEAAGFERDDEQDSFDPRTDFLGLIFEQGRRFEEGVLRLIGERLPLVRISTGVED